MSEPGLQVALRRLRRMQRMAVVTSGMLLCVVLAGCASNPPRQTEDLCSIFEQKFGWHRAALQQQKKWRVPLYTTMAIMAQESSYRSEAKPPRKYYFGIIPGPRPSSAYGYSQALDGTWDMYVKQTGEYWRQRDDFVDALDFINWYVVKTVSQNGISPSDTYKQYLNYHEGWAGYRKGTYKKKAWLTQVAKRVKKRADNYEAQHRKCRKVRKPFLRWWVS